MSGLVMSGLVMSGPRMLGAVKTGLGTYRRGTSRCFGGGVMCAPGVLSQREGTAVVFVFE